MPENPRQDATVNARKAILRELDRRFEEGLPPYTRPAEIAGFAEKPDRFQAAVNALLQERLINGTRDGEGRLAIAINHHRHEDVKRALRPWYALPVAWLAFGILLAGAIVVVTAF
jgi:hypothetical protein